MSNKLFSYLYVSLFCFAAAGCMAENQYSEPNTDKNYEKTSTTVDEYGTKTTQTVKQEVDVDEEGDASTTYKAKTTTDPKGLMNKSTTEKTETYKEDND